MGFMAGFGPAFSRGLEAGLERKAQKEQDAFRFTMQDLINQRDKYAEWVREDSKAAKKAKSYLEGSSAPSDAFPLVVEWVKADLSESEIQHRLLTGKFNIEKPVEGVEKVEGVAPVDQQMAATGLAPDASTPSPPPSIATPAAQAKKGGLLSQLFGRGKTGTADQRRREGAIDKASAQLGVDPATARSMLSGDYETQTGIPQNHGVTFTPGAPEREPDPFAANASQTFFELREAQVEAQQLGRTTPRLEQAIRRVNAVKEAEIFENQLKNGSGGVVATIWKDGQYQTTTQVNMLPDGTFKGVKGEIYGPEEVHIMSEVEKESLDDIEQSLEKDRKDLLNKEDNFVGSLRSVAIMSEIIRKTNNEVLAPRTPYLFKTGQEWLKDISVAANHMTKLFTESKPGEQVATKEQYNQLLAAEARLQREGSNDLGAQIGLFDIQKAMFAYRLAASMGQEGRSLAETERKMFTEMATSGIDPARFYQGMADLLVPAARQIDDYGNAIYSGNGAIKKHEDEHEYTPARYSHQSIMDKMKETSDPDLKLIWKQLGFFNRREEGGDAPVLPDTGGTPPPVATPAPDQKVYPKPSQKAIDTLKANPNVRAQFEEMFGPGSANMVLGGQ